jgi:hypothetical protein
MSDKDPKNSKDSFIQNAIDELSKLTRLEIHTLVGNYSFLQDDKGVNSVIKNDSTADRMSSQINLLTGDITTAMTDKFVTEYKELREYHTSREKEGHEIIEKNIKTLKEIVDAIVELTGKKDSKT